LCGNEGLGYQCRLSLRGEWINQKIQLTSEASSQPQAFTLEDQRTRAASKSSQPAAKSRRTQEMRPSSLVAKVQKQQGKSSCQVPDELTAKYDLRPTETSAKVNEIRVARQARRAFARVPTA